MDSIDTIKDAFNDIPDMFDGWFNVRERLFNMNLEQERRHRHGERTPKRFSARLAAKYFVCRHLLDGIAEPDRFTVDDILSIRNEVLYAQAYAKRHLDLLQPWAEEWREDLGKVDYAELMRMVA